jgi:hypothetical protein
VTIDLAGELLLAALAVRVFGRDAALILRRAAATGVRIGVRELHRTGHREGQR